MKCKSNLFYCGWTIPFNTWAQFVPSCYFLFFLCLLLTNHCDVRESELLLYIIIKILCFFLLFFKYLLLSLLLSFEFVRETQTELYHSCCERERERVGQKLLAELISLIINSNIPIQLNYRSCARRRTNYKCVTSTLTRYCYVIWSFIRSLPHSFIRTLASYVSNRYFCLSHLSATEIVRILLLLFILALLIENFCIVVAVLMIWSHFVHLANCMPNSCTQTLIQQSLTHLNAIPLNEFIRVIALTDAMRKIDETISNIHKRKITTRQLEYSHMSVSTFCFLVWPQELFYSAAKYASARVSSK